MFDWERKNARNKKKREKEKKERKRERTVGVEKNM
tara:strand:+ start:144 stop:248 length:105 start_codon:yes stop_codon:yes gene_type:complete